MWLRTYQTILFPPKQKQGEDNKMQIEREVQCSHIHELNPHSVTYSQI